MEEYSLNVVLVRHIQLPIRMLSHAIDECPDVAWVKSEGHPPIWQHVLHTTYYLQKWIRTPEEPFEPPAFADFAAVDFVAPSEPALARDVLSGYTSDVKNRALSLLQGSDNLLLTREVRINDGVTTLLDQTFGQIRHISYHVGCISTLFDRYTGEPLPWIVYEGKTPA